MKNMRRGLVISFLFSLFLFGGAGLLEATTISVSPTACRPWSSDLTAWLTTEYMTLLTQKFNKDTYFVVPLNLPDGVKLKRLTVYVTDNAGGAADYMKIYIRRDEKTILKADVLKSISTYSLASNPGRQMITRSITQFNVIDNAKYSYAFVVQFAKGCSPWTVGFNGATIEY